jgi:hypothetical protein
VDKILNKYNATKMVPTPEILDNVRKLVVAHANHDETGFSKSAETIIRELTMSNRPSEAKALRDALRLAQGNGSKGLARIFHS